MPLRAVGCRTPCSELGDAPIVSVMAGAIRAPHALLRPYLGEYQGYREHVHPLAVHHGVASPSATVVLSFDQPLDCGWAREPDQHGTYWTLSSGLHVAPALIRPHGFQHGVQLALTPRGVRALLGVPAAAIARELVAGGALPLAGDPDLQARLAEAPSWAARFDLLDEVLLAAVARWGDSARSEVPSEVARAWRLLAGSHGGLRINELAAEVGWSRRHLVGRFTAELGVGPKQVARLFRFDHARRLAAGGCPLAEVAARTGYADQAHLSREWRQLAGQAPTATLADPFSFLQDDSGADLAASRA